VINRAVGSTDVLLALIGDRWLTIADDQGRRRLDDPDDFVRLEIEAALARKIRVIPILVDGAAMPDVDELPPSLARLARRQALDLSPSRFEFDTNRLLRVLDKTLADVHTADRRPSVPSETQTSDPSPRRASLGRREADTVEVDRESAVSTPRGVLQTSIGAKWRGRFASRPLMMIGVASAALIVVAAIVAIIATSDSDTSSSPPNPTGIAIPFEDDFSTRQYHWSGGNYGNGLYEVTARRGTEGVSVNAAPQGGSSSGDVRITVTAHRTGGTARVGFGYGIFCKGDGPDNLYAFNIWRSDVSLSKRVDGHMDNLLPSNRDVRAAIEDDPEKDLEAVCASTSVEGKRAVLLQFLVDGEVILQATDVENPLEGDAYGLRVNLRPPLVPEASTEDTLVATFDDFGVSRP